MSINNISTNFNAMNYDPSQSQYEWTETVPTVKHISCSPFSYNTPGLSTGIPLYRTSAGETITSMWLNINQGFTGPNTNAFFSLFSGTLEQPEGIGYSNSYINDIAPTPGGTIDIIFASEVALYPPFCSSKNIVNGVVNSQVSDLNLIFLEPDTIYGSVATSYGLDAGLTAGIATLNFITTTTT